MNRIIRKFKKRMAMAEADVLEHCIDYCIRGHHIYKNNWSPVIGEVLVCKREPGNPKDRYAVAVSRQEERLTVVGHLPSKISKLCSLFIRRGGSIECAVSGVRHHTTDLPQGGLEVPCQIKFKAIKKELDKLKKCIARHSS